MIRRAAAALFVTLLGALSAPAQAQDVDDESALALEALSEAAAGVVVDDRARVEAAAARAAGAAAAARTALDGLEDVVRRHRRAVRRAEKVIARTSAAAELLEDADTPRLGLVRAFGKAAREASRLRRDLAASRVTTSVYLSSGAATPLRKKDGVFKLKVRPLPSGVEGPLSVSVGASLPTDLEPPAAGFLRLVKAKSGRFNARIEGGPAALRLDTTLEGAPSIWLVVRGPDSGLAGPLSPVIDLDGVEYDDTSPSFRVGEAAALAAPDTGDEAPDTLSIEPALPDGLAFDAVTGAISGVPTSTHETSTFTVTATKGSFVHTAVLRLDVAPALPTGIEALEDGFAAEPLLSGLSVPVKMAFTPDGRLLFSELGTGNIRVVSAEGDLLAQPFATLPISTGGERGLLGLAVAPDFATSGHVFAYVSTPAGDGHPDRNRVVRFTANGDTGEALTVVLDDLPIAAIHNGGGLAFGPDGHLYVSVGDATVEANAQTDGVPAGKVLRIAADGSIPSDNPTSADPEWCRGLRNPFDIAFHPRTGGLFISENGPTANDELNFGQKDKNFGWGPVPPDLPEFKVGLRIQDWTPVIVPTGITFVSPEAFGAAYEDDLFLCSYDHAEVRRVVLSGDLLTDLDEEVSFLRFEDPESIANKPLDVAEAPDGALHVSTFSGIWRITRWSR